MPISPGCGCGAIVALLEILSLVSQIFFEYELKTVDDPVVILVLRDERGVVFSWLLHLINVVSSSHVDMICSSLPQSVDFLEEHADSGWWQDFSALFACLAQPLLLLDSTVIRSFSNIWS